jgi:hypothetical protein
MLLDETTIEFILLLTHLRQLQCATIYRNRLALKQYTGLEPRLHSYPAITHGANFVWLWNTIAIEGNREYMLRNCY